MEKSKINESLDKVDKKFSKAYSLKKNSERFYSML